MMSHDLRHLDTETPCVLVVDGSKLVRKLIADVLRREVPGVQVIGCSSIAEARAALEQGEVHLVTTALALPDGDGLEIARSVREAAGQAYVPVIVVSGDAQQHLEERRFTEFVTDYFDKALGHEALATFIRGYVQPEFDYWMNRTGYTYRNDEGEIEREQEKDETYNMVRYSQNQGMLVIYVIDSKRGNTIWQGYTAANFDLASPNFSADITRAAYRVMNEFKIVNKLSE